MLRGVSLAGALAALISVAGCGGGSGNPSGSAGQMDSIPSAGSTLSAAAQLGARIFNDQALSVSGRQSCATCHVAQYAFSADPTASGPDHGSPVPLGGADMDEPGFRNTPSLMYLSFAPAFHFEADGKPNGGFFRDGRAATLADQAQMPFTTPFEMANADAAMVIARLQTRPYLSDFVALFGAAVLQDPATALQRVGVALAAFETESEQFHPFSSKYDFWQRGEVQLSAQEQRGLALFNSPTKGNCAACHPGSSADGVTPALFTDFSYDNLGVPRNRAIPANLDSGAPSSSPIDSDDGTHLYFDLGICGPFRDNGGRNMLSLCGQFKVPTLRNVAITGPYFHNGRFATLQEAVTFYVRRDTNPETFYPVAADGTVTKFDDLPALYGGLFAVHPDRIGSDSGYAGNVNTLEIPYNRHLGDRPALASDEINDLVAFLCTLTDGYDPQNPSAQYVPPQCQAALAADKS